MHYFGAFGTSNKSPESKYIKVLTCWKPMGKQELSEALKSLEKPNVVVFFSHFGQDGQVSSCLLVLSKKRHSQGFSPSHTPSNQK